VVVKAVPPGATAVGIPARIFTAEETANQNPSFLAYGLSADMQDPLVQAVTQLLADNEMLKERLAVLEARF
jgi:serine O-acetyltransferase